MHMALTSKKPQRGGWQRQAEHLVLKHTTVATAAMVAVEQAIRGPVSKPVSCDFRADVAESERQLNKGTIEYANERGPTRAKLAGHEQQMAQATATAWLLNGRRETLAARAARCATADKRVAELESELNSMHEQLVLREDENHSLRMSMDMVVGANWLLSSRLTESDTRVDQALAQLEQMQISLNAGEAARNKLELQVQDLEQSRSKLIDDTNKLLRTCKTRDADLARAEERISLLAKLFSQLETKATRSESQETVEQLSQSQHQRIERTVNETVHRKVRANGAVLKRELDKDEWLFSSASTF
jgi:hypothetical protein